MCVGFAAFLQSAHEFCVAIVAEFFSGKITVDSSAVELFDEDVIRDTSHHLPPSVLSTPPVQQHPEWPVVNGKLNGKSEPCNCDCKRHIERCL